MGSQYNWGGEAQDVVESALISIQSAMVGVVGMQCSNGL